MARRTLDQKLLPLAQRFAEQVARLVEKDTRRTVASEVGAQLRSYRAGNGIGTGRGRRKIVVECPVPGCDVQGVRTLSNFCVEHNRSVTEAEKKTLREAQREARASGASKA